MTATDKRCGNCVFFSYPNCRRRAPIAVENQVGESYPDGYRRFAVVSAFDWCGEFRPEAKAPEPPHEFFPESHEHVE